jgi:alpha-D-ribose 1-methylphosphonate 5-triphosphate synthase subunit PhnG
MRALLEEADRAHWMSTLSRCDPSRLEAAWTGLDRQPGHSWLRPPEIGLVMLRGRAGGTGQPFNLGEMTMTRAVVLIEEGGLITGFGYVAGRAPRHAELAALFDALLQDENRRTALLSELIAPLAAEARMANENRAKDVASTRVDFTTMVRGND